MHDALQWQLRVIAGMDKQLLRIVLLGYTCTANHAPQTDVKHICFLGQPSACFNVLPTYLCAAWPHILARLQLPPAALTPSHLITHLLR